MFALKTTRPLLTEWYCLYIASAVSHQEGVPLIESRSHQARSPRSNNASIPRNPLFSFLVADTPSRRWQRWVHLTRWSDRLPKSITEIDHRIRLYWIPITYRWQVGEGNAVRASSAENTHMFLRRRKSAYIMVPCLFESWKQKLVTYQV